MELRVNQDVDTIRLCLKDKMEKALKRVYAQRRTSQDSALIHVLERLVARTELTPAQITQNPEFDKKWLGAGSKEELKDIILLAKRRRG